MLFKLFINSSGIITFISIIINKNNIDTALMQTKIQARPIKFNPVKIK